MTGMECFWEEMLKRGCTKAQIGSKAVAIALDIISQKPQMIFSMFQDAEERVNTLESMEQNLKIRIKRLQLEESKQQGIIRRCQEDAAEYVNKEWKREQEYIDSFYAALKSCETPEGRDRLRAAQIYANSVKKETPGERQAYAYMLGALLAGVSGPEAGEFALRNVKPKTGKVWSDDDSFDPDNPPL